MIANVHSTHIGKKHKQHDPKPSSMVSPGTVPHTTHKNDESHLHWALLIRRLLLD